MVTRTLAHLLLVVGLVGALVLAVEPSVFSTNPPTTVAIELQTKAIDSSSVPDRLTIPSISLAEQVVRAGRVDEADRTTWEIPAFAVGHVEGSAGAGEPGNVVLIGHVESRQAGNVFKELRSVRQGDVVELWSGDRGFTYQVSAVQTVTRHDASVLGPSEQATITLITCAGQWIPFVRDYSERLVVSGILVTETDTAGL